MAYLIADEITVAAYPPKRVQSKGPNRRNCEMGWITKIGWREKENLFYFLPFGIVSR
ncbi:MAG: hypothetical protein NUV57_04380 [archaeon]|nr:hypothetical protein [archaeon]